MKRTFVALAAATTVGLTLTVGGASVSADTSGHGHGAPDTYVMSWDDTASRAWTAAAQSPSEGVVLFAYLGIAEYDAVMAVTDDHQPFAVIDNAPADASPEAAVAAAAHRVLVHFLPNQQATIIDPAFTASLATIPDGQPKTDGVALGERVASALIALRADDGYRSTAYPYTPPDPPIPGVWLPTALPPARPLGTYLGHMRPFALDSTDQFRPGSPPDLDSKRWARDYNEVKSLGSSASTTRTPEQTETARFWAEPPVQQMHAAFRGVIAQHGLGIADATRFMAMATVTVADAAMACFDAKYHYAFWRPVTAIRAGQTDGNDATVGDHTWSPLIATPNHPEYPSAHGCQTPAGGYAIARFLGTKWIDYTVPSLTGLHPRHFDTVRELAEDVGNGRVWAGIHYRTSVEVGAKTAKQTANWVLDRNFEPTDD
jgi:hypothetical protein